MLVAGIHLVAHPQPQAWCLAPCALASRCCCLPPPAGVLAVVRSWQNEYVQPFTGMVPISTGGRAAAPEAADEPLLLPLLTLSQRLTRVPISPGLWYLLLRWRCPCLPDDLCVATVACAPSRMHHQYRAGSHLIDCPTVCRRGGRGPRPLPGGQRADAERAGPGRFHRQGPQVGSRCWFRLAGELGGSCLRVLPSASPRFC